MEKLEPNVKNYIAIHEVGHFFFGILDLLQRGVRAREIKSGVFLVFNETNPEGEDHGSSVKFNALLRKKLSPTSYLAGCVSAICYLYGIKSVPLDKENLISTMKTTGGANDIEAGKLEDIDEERLVKSIKFIQALTFKFTDLFTELANEAMESGTISEKTIDKVITNIQENKKNKN